MNNLKLQRVSFDFSKLKMDNLVNLRFVRPWSHKWDRQGTPLNGATLERCNTRHCNTKVKWCNSNVLTKDVLKRYQRIYFHCNRRSRIEWFNWEMVFVKIFWKMWRFNSMLHGPCMNKNGNFESEDYVQSAVCLSDIKMFINV